MCENKKGLFHVVLKRPFGTVENSTQLCNTGKLTLQFVYDYFPHQKATICLFWEGKWEEGNGTISKKTRFHPLALRIIGSS